MTRLLCLVKVSLDIALSRAQRAALVFVSGLLSPLGAACGSQTRESVTVDSAFQDA
jgi:hypothetical protein